MNHHRSYDSKVLKELFGRKRIATIDQLKEALGTDVDMTVYRKLKELCYHTSYSHRGRYYTLEEIARFDEMGLWSFRSVWFSRHGTLLSTARVLVETSEAGFFASELEQLLHVGVKDALRTLVCRKKLNRQQVSSRWLYCSLDGHKRSQQLGARHMLEEGGTVKLPTYTETAADQLKAAIIIFFSLLDERQRRLYAGLESLKWGHGGDTNVASLLGLDPKTVARGRKELAGGEIDPERVRKAGAGRRSVKKGLPR